MVLSSPAATLDDERRWIMDSRWPRYSTGILLAAVGLGALAALHRCYGRALLEHGMRLVADRQYARAVAVLRRAVVVTPAEPRAHYYLSLAHAGAGNLGPWLNHLEEAMSRAALDARLHEALSCARRRRVSTVGAPAVTGGAPR
jgi:hypothetical protein